MTQSATMGFNSNNYDILMIFLAIQLSQNKTPEEACLMLKKASDRIIQQQLKPWDFRDLYNLQMPRIDHVDLIEVAPGRASLKLYGGRVHTKKMQDLPIEPDEHIQPEERPIVLNYNKNDLYTTSDLRDSLKKQLELRCNMSTKYGLDLRSKSDAQVAEAVISQAIQKASGNKPQKPKFTPGQRFHIKIPEYINFQTELMQSVAEHIAGIEFYVKSDGKVELPASIKDNHIHLGDSVYRMGIGGLHSSEEKVFHLADDEYLLVDRDVASYYPRIILNHKLYPKQLGVEFLRVYETIVNTRLAAKDSGDKVVADSLKITINGSFGKYGSRWSILYSPELLIQTTLTGQLSLLLLIETIELAGISVVSANTDGLVIKCKRTMKDELDQIIALWEKQTGYTTEETFYRAVYSRDVNNYIAQKLDGTYKAKGAYGEPTLQKNPTNLISVEAAIDWLLKSELIEDKILSCDDVRKFVNVRQVKGGAVKRHGAIPIPEHETKEELIMQAGYELQPHRLTRWGKSPDGKLMTTGEAYKAALKDFTQFENEDYLGKAIRWVYAKGVEGPIQYKTDSRIVARSEGARALMDLDNFKVPYDLDYDWYIKEAYSILSDFGIPEERLHRHPLI